MISAINKAVTSKSQQGIFNIGSGKSYSIKEIAECINEVFENKGNISFKPNQHEGRFNIYMDCTKAKELLRWSPEWTLKGALYDIKNKMTNQ